MTNTAIHALAVFVALAFAGPAGAATIAVPDRNPAPARGGVALTIEAAGFTAGAQVFVEQCDGTAPTSPQWSPASNCDVGSSPAPAIADAKGRVRFAGDDENHAFRPFSGESPQSLFNCLPRGAAKPANGLPTFDNCQVRVSTNNLAPTSDQVFVRIALAPGPAATGLPTTTTTTIARRYAATAPATIAGKTASPSTTTTVAPRAPAAADGGSPSLTAAKGSGGSASLDLNEGASAPAFFAIGGVLALACVLLRRRGASSRRE